MSISPNCLKLPIISIIFLSTNASSTGCNVLLDSFEKSKIIDNTSLCQGDLPEAGTLASDSVSLPNGATTACDKKTSARTLVSTAVSYIEKPIVPNAIYNAACQTAGGEKKMFTSLTIKEGANERGQIIESVFQNGKMLQTKTLEFPECKEMHGITTDSSCSFVGVLCRNDERITGNEDFKKDLVAEYPVKMWRDMFTQAIAPTDSDEVKERKNNFDTEWIYEWPEGNISASPDRYVLHKGIGGWEYGRQELVFSDTLGYGAYLKTANGGHETDTFMVIRREKDLQNKASLTINNRRGWKSSCATGHTVFNHAAYNPTSQRFAGICGTDYGAIEGAQRGYGGLWVSVDGKRLSDGYEATINGTERGFFSIPRTHTDHFAGGVGNLLPLDDGGFLGVFTGIKNASKTNYDWRRQGPTTSIALARFNPDGELITITWIVGDKDRFYASPQIAVLGEDKYLLGYAKMAKLSDNAEPYFDKAMRLPGSFHVVEIDGRGNRLTAEKTIDKGWGDQDNWVSWGDGKVAWAYLPEPTYKTEQQGATAVVPSCEVDKLSLNVYQSK